MQKVSFFLVLFFNFNSQNRPLSSSIPVSLSPPANMYDLVCIELDYDRAQYGIERDTLLFIRGTGNFNWSSMVVELEVKLIEHDTPSANQSGARIGIGARDQILYLGNRARVRYLELEYLFELQIDSRSRCRAR